MIAQKLLPIFKEHNLKAIHNFALPNRVKEIVVTNIQRTQFKSNSQLRYNNDRSNRRCYQYSKNTI